MSKFPRDNTAACIAFYGNPAGANGMASGVWQQKNLVRVAFPWLCHPSWDMTKRMVSCQFHKLAAPTLEAVFQDLWNQAGHDQKKIAEAGLDKCGGTFNFRPKRGLNSLSVHAFGAAIDFDPERNGLGDATPHMPRWVVETFKRHGAVWGGDFRRHDGMHFQFADI